MLVLFGILCFPASAAFDSSWIGRYYDITSPDPEPEPVEDTESFYSSARLRSVRRPLMAASPASSSSGSSEALSVDLDFSSAVITPHSSNTLSQCFGISGLAQWRTQDTTVPPVIVNGQTIVPGYTVPGTLYQQGYSVLSGDVSSSVVNQSESSGWVFGWRSSVSLPPSVTPPSSDQYTLRDVSIGSYPTISSFDVSIPVHFDQPVYGFSVSFSGDSPSYRFLSESNGFLDRVSAAGSFFLIVLPDGTQLSGQIGVESVFSLSSPVQDVTIQFFSPTVGQSYSLSDVCPWWVGFSSGDDFEDCFSSGSYFYQYVLEIPAGFRFNVSGSNGFVSGNQMTNTNQRITDSRSSYASAEDSFITSGQSSVSAALPSDLDSALDADAVEGLSAAGASFGSIWDVLPVGFLGYFVAFMCVGLAAFILRRVG